jgi:hypothetical protein
MLIGMSFVEGEYPLAVEVNDCDLPEIINTGKWDGKPIAALFFSGGLIYDFVLRRYGESPIRSRLLPCSIPDAVYSIPIEQR